MSRALVRASHFDPPKPRGRSAVARAHHLLRLAFAAIRRTPERPLIAGAKISREQTIRNDRRTLRGNAFVVEAESSEPRPVLLARVGNNVDHLAAIAQSAQFVESQEGSTGEVCLHTQHTIEFDGMTDG